MTGQFLVRNEKGHERPVDTRAEAESVKGDMEELGMSVEIIPPGHAENPEPAETEDAHQPSAPVSKSVADGGETTTQTTEATETPAQGYDLPDKPPVDQDPIVWMPEEFTDEIDGTVAINRKGFEVIVHHYDVAITTELVTSPVDADNIAVVRATATTRDGVTYTAFGSASKDRGDDTGLLVEMADTRAYKRAASRATGVGMVAVDELKTGGQ